MLRRQAGSAAAEFGIVALAFFTLLLGIIEVGRMLYVWSTVQEVTRRAAREAAVRDFTTQVPVIQLDAVFNSGTSGTAYLPAAAEVSSAKVQISYLNNTMSPASPLPTDPGDNISACNDATRTASCIRYVEACVAVDGVCATAVQFQPMLAGMFPFLALSIPVSTVVIPAESLGFYPS